MQAPLKTLAVDSRSISTQIKRLILGNQDHFLSKYELDPNVPRDLLVESLSKNLGNEIVRGKSTAEGIIDETSGHVLGLVVGEIAEWDTEHFGTSMGKVTFALFEPSVKTEMRAAVFRKLSNKLNLQMVSFRMSLKDLPSIQAVQAEGGILVDVLLTYRFQLGRFSPVHTSSTEVSLAKEQDAAELKRIAGSVFTADRFHGDPHIPTSKSDRLYEKWVTSSLGGQADAVLVARRDSALAGFITCNVQEIAPGCKVGAIDLVGVKSTYAGIGVGHELVTSSLEWFGKRVRSVYVGTQASNSRATRLYEGCGFVHVNSEASLHLWQESSNS